MVRVRALAGLLALVVVGAVVASAQALPPPGGGPPRGEPGRPPRPGPGPGPLPGPSCVAKAYTDQEVLSATSFTTPPASAFWCGNHWRLLGRDLNPLPDEWVAGRPNLGFADTCHSNAQRADGTWVPAQVRAEIRGWIAACPPESMPPALRAVTDLPPVPPPSDPGLPGKGQDDFEQEIHFMIQPDIDWTPSTPDVWPLNTFERVAQWMRPMGENYYGFLKVEYNLWAPLRVCGFNQKDLLGHHLEANRKFWNQGNGPFCSAWDLGTQRPPEWCFRRPDVVAPIPFDFDAPPHTSATPAGAFKLGDYVRIVGTLWEDENHNGAEPCYEGTVRSARRGWTEIHPVDFMARIPSPRPPPQPGFSRTGLAFQSICFSSTTTHTELVRVPILPPARPQGNVQLRVREIVDPEFTNFTSITGNAVESQRVQISGASAMSSVEISSQAGVRRGLFHAAYQATWEPCTLQCDGKCGGAPNGCGGRCTGGCASGQACSRGACCPAGTQWCGDACAAKCTCEPCPCGGTSCVGSAACTHVCGGGKGAVRP